MNKKQNVLNLIRIAAYQGDDRDAPGTRALHGLYELFAAAMEATNTYWEPDGSDMWVNVERVVKGITPELFAAFLDESFTR